MSIKSKVYKEFYDYPIPFDPTKGIDAFSEVEEAPKLDDVDDEFKVKNCYMSNPKIMRAGVDYPYTQEQLQEFQKCSDNIFYFIVNYCKVTTLNSGVDLLRLYQYQKNAIKLMHENRFTIFKFPRQMGKALDEDVLIKMADGTYKKLKDVQLGEYVVDHDNNPTQVVYKTERFLDHECYKLTFLKDGVTNSLVCDKGHLWGVYNSSGEYVIVTTYELHREPQSYSLLDDGVTLHSIKKTASRPLYCIEVDSKDHLFKVTDFDITTHNCVSNDTKLDVSINGTVANMSIGQLYDLIETDNLVESYTPNNDYEIYTDEGYKGFDGITTRYSNELVEISCDNGSIIKCTPDHEIRLHDGKFIKGSDLSIGDDVGVNESVLVTNIELKHGNFKVADVIEVEDTHSFSVDDMTAILSNCIDGDSIVTLKDNETGEIFDVAVKDLYKYLESNDE